MSRMSNGNNKGFQASKLKFSSQIIKNKKQIEKVS